MCVTSQQEDWQATYPRRWVEATMPMSGLICRIGSHRPLVQRGGRQSLTTSSYFTHMPLSYTAIRQHTVSSAYIAVAMCDAQRITFPYVLLCPRCSRRNNASRTYCDITCTKRIATWSVPVGPASERSERIKCTGR